MSATQRPKLLRSHRQLSRTNVKAACHVRQIGCRLNRLRLCNTPHAVAGVAPKFGEQQLPALCRRTTGPDRRLSLHGEPAIKLVRHNGNDMQRHLGVLIAAKLCAHAAMHSRLFHLNTYMLDTAWDHVDLAAESGDPEAVNDIGRRQSEHDGTPHGHADFVCRADFASSCGVAIPDLPPPLNTRYFDHQVCSNRMLQWQAAGGRIGEQRRQHNDRKCNCHLQQSRSKHGCAVDDGALAPARATPSRPQRSRRHQRSARPLPRGLWRQMLWRDVARQF